MGKFLRDAKGGVVYVEGAPVLEKVLDRKPRDCQGCGFSKWVKNDKLFIVQNSAGAMNWLCPDCACDRGLPDDYHHKNHYAPYNSRVAATQERMNKQRNVESATDFSACMCGF